MCYNWDMEEEFSIDRIAKWFDIPPDSPSELFPEGTTFEKMEVEINDDVRDIHFLGLPSITPIAIALRPTTTRQVGG